MAAAMSFWELLGHELCFRELLPRLDAASLVAASLSCRALKAMGGAEGDTLALAQRVAEQAVRAIAGDQACRWR